MTKATALLLLLALTSSLRAQEPTIDVSALVTERLAAVRSVPLADLWQNAIALAAAAGEDNRAALDTAVDAELAPEKVLDPNAALFLSTVRLGGSEPDAERIRARLEPLLDSTDDAIAKAAVMLLADRAFVTLKEEEREALAKRVSEVAKDGKRAPEVRLAAASTLHAQGGGAAQREARTTMGEFLNSSDGRLRALGALALAQTGDTETPRIELERLAEIPDENGRLAASYLKQDELRRIYDRRQKNILEYAKKQAADTDLSGDRDMQRMEQLMRLIETTSLEGEKKKRDDLITAAMDGMMRSLDEHSSYLTPKAYKEMEQDLLNPDYGGIGAYVGEDPDDRLFTIRQPIYSGPAYRAGLHSDDKIVRIDDWPTFTPQGSRPLDEIIKRLKGKPGTMVKLYVWRRGMDGALIDRPTEDMAVEIQREEITIPPVKSDLLPGGIAHIELTTFSRVATAEIRKKLLEYKDQGLKGVILDLRQNQGGLLDQARDVANLFLPKKKLIVTTESRVFEPQSEITMKDALLPADMPVAVLTSRFSASASEIVAGALQDYQRAAVVGQRSFGKGSVQQLLKIPGEEDDRYDDENKNGHHDSWEKLTKDLNANGEFDFGPRARMTISRYKLPSGRSIHREFDDDGKLVSEGGVVPDVSVDNRRFEAWKLEEFRRVQKERKIRDYLDANYAKNKALFTALAAGDADDTTRYPGFDALYASLETTLSKADVRYFLRRELRGRAQDDRGAAFPEGDDYEDDPVLQAAIRNVLEKLSIPVDSIQAYASTFDPKDKSSERLTVANLTDAARTDLRHALSLIGEAKGGSALSAERLAEIEKALQSVIDR
ncbi:MAG: S41 family peptidase [Planctomycetota bacterium]|nr:S41 family peptidase [Planctomycetota bacterium]